MSSRHNLQDGTGVIATDGVGNKLIVVEDLGSAGGDAPAVDDPPRRLFAEGNPTRDKALAQRGQRLVRVHVGLVGKEQPRREPPRQIGLKIVGPHPVVAAGGAGEAVELARVARRGDHQLCIMRGRLPRRITVWRDGSAKLPTGH